MCRWWGTSASLQVCTMKTNSPFNILLPNVHNDLISMNYTLLLFKVNLQHDGTHVWSESDIWPTCHHCPKVPGLAPASHLRDLRVSVKTVEHLLHLFPQLK